MRGRDTDGNHYESVDEMWQCLTASGTAAADWYHRAADHYEDQCEASVDGVLGGFASISELDLQGSRDFLKEVQYICSIDWSCGAACECGAGIGRVTKGLLLDLGVSRCDLVESSSRLLSAAPDYIEDGASKCRFFCNGLQVWEPMPRTYSIVWIQWVFCYLQDNDGIDFLRRCGQSLVEGGVICLKENTCDEGVDDFIVDLEDASVTRSIPYVKHMANQAGLRVVHETLQTDFPGDIYTVPMLALQPQSWSTGESTAQNRSSNLARVVR